MVRSNVNSLVTAFEDMSHHLDKLEEGIRFESKRHIQSVNGRVLSRILNMYDLEHGISKTVELGDFRVSGTRSPKSIRDDGAEQWEFSFEFNGVLFAINVDVITSGTVLKKTTYENIELNSSNVPYPESLLVPYFETSLESIVDSSLSDSPSSLTDTPKENSKVTSSHFDDLILYCRALQDESDAGHYYLATCTMKGDRTIHFIAFEAHETSVLSKMQSHIMNLDTTCEDISINQLSPLRAVVLKEILPTLK
ncbi:hypothetical protein BC455_17910 [Vibrio harveyi]|uniref:hypothetical protein n=2 Tax=Vibrio harveyi group TaxID=717610 RepID=UPI000841B3CE|nr:hypothetical protein [Vibrio harveyi]ODM56968.1 hypothetical protein BC455_17910 [Vibrio harveyi]